MALTISATDTELPKPINNVLADTFLSRALPKLPYFVGSKPGQIAKQQGTSTIKWRRIEQMAPSTTALAELTGVASYMQGRSSVAASVTDLVATLAKYGQFYIIPEEVDLYDPAGTAGELIATLGEAAGRSLNQLQRNVMEDNATQAFAGNVASTGVVKAKPTAGDIDRIVVDLDTQSAQPFTPTTNGSQNIGTAPILASLWAICHPHVAYDWSKLTGFVSVEKYNGQVRTAPGEFGFYGGAGIGVRFIRSEDASIDINAGAPISGADVRSSNTTDADIYTTVFFGREAFGSVGLGQSHTDGAFIAGDDTGDWEIIVMGLGSGGTSDPFKEITTMAYKAYWAGSVLNPNWSRSLRSAATDLNN